MRRLDFSVSGLGDSDHELRRRERRGSTYLLIAVLASLVVLGRGYVVTSPTGDTSTVIPTAPVAPSPQAVTQTKPAAQDSKPVAKTDAKQDGKKKSDSKVPPAVVLRIAPNPIEFGEQTVNAAGAPVPITIRNDGAGPASLPQIGAMDLQYQSFAVVGKCAGRELPAHEVCEDEVTFIPQAIGEQSATFVIADMHFKRLATATMHGTGRGTAAVEAYPSTLAFEEFGVDRQTTTVSNGGATSLVIHDVSIQGSDGDDKRFNLASDKCKGGTFAPHAQCSIDIAMRPRDADLSLDAELVLNNSAPGPDFVVPLSWRAAPQATLRLQPTRFRFGTLYVAQSSSIQTTMTNTGVAPTRIGELRFDTMDAGAPFSASNDCGQELRPGATCSLTVVANPTGPGAFNTTLHIVDSHGRPLADAPVSLDARPPQTTDTRPPQTTDGPIVR